MATLSGMVVYLGTAIALRAKEPREFVRLLTMRRAARPPAGAP
jgi:hypothetical protein